MEASKGFSAHGRVRMHTEKKPTDWPDFVKDLIRFSIVTIYADRMLEKQILSPSELKKFEKETAGLFSMKNVHKSKLFTR